MAASEHGRRNLVVIGPSYPFRGGISHYTTLLVRELRQIHDVSLINFKRQYPDFLFPGKTQFDFSEKALAEPNERIIDTLNPFSWLRAARIVRRADPDLTIFQWWHPYFAPTYGTILRLLGRRLRRKSCFLCHNVLPHERSPLQRMLGTYAFDGARFFIVHSEQDREQLSELRPNVIVRKGQHPTYSEFGAGVSMDKTAARRLLGSPADKRTILYFGLVRPYKGLRYLIEALPAVLKEIDCTLIIAGEFYDDKQQYLDMIAEAGIQSSVRVVDQYIPNEEIPQYFKSADVVVLPYTSATQSGVVQIAFGLGVPVITTDVGGLPEAVDHDRTGLIAESANAAGLANAIIRYYSDELECKFRLAIESQTDRFSWSEEVGFIDEFLQSEV